MALVGLDEHIQVVVDGLVGCQEHSGGGAGLPDDGVAGVAGEGAAGDLHADAVFALEAAGGGR